MRDGEVNRLSVEPSGLISARVIVPHATLEEDKAWGRSDCGGRHDGRTLALRRVGDTREEGLQPFLLATGRQRDAISQHRGLSSGVASGKSSGSRYAYGWVETSTPLSSCTHSWCYF
jgi:hypothetical protein